MQLPPEEVMRMPINLRKWMFERFLQQKEDEKQQMEAAQKRGKHR